MGKRQLPIILKKLCALQRNRRIKDKILLEEEVDEEEEEEEEEEEGIILEARGPNISKDKGIIIIAYDVT